MVVRSIFFFLIISTYLAGGEFKATVNRQSIQIGESMTLSLTLGDGSTKEIPSIESLHPLFLIHSQQQLYTNTINNGKVATKIIWKYTLIPQEEGELTIPSITLNTTEGVLSTAPIKIQVAKASAVSDGEAVDPEGVTLATEVSNNKPYKNEPFVYTFRLSSEQNLMNIRMQKIVIEDAIVEANGEPQIYEKHLNGISTKVVEFSYLITPLKAGPLKIPSNVIQGEMLLKNGSHGGSPFDDNFHFFSMIGGINQLKPFALASKEEVLEIEPMIAGITPWLPVKSLKIEETWDDSHSLQVGEPFSRGFKITAEGIKPTHLPSLNDLQKGDEFFKIYADKPVLGDEGKGGNLISYRQEQYTLIPQQPGTFTLPEILITWWDVIKKEKVISRIPSRVVKVIPSQYKSSPEISEKGVNDGVVIETKRDFFLYMILGGVIVLLIGAIIWGVMLQNKIKGLRDGSKPKPPSPPVHCSLKENSPKKNKNERLKDLNPT